MANCCCTCLCKCILIIVNLVILLVFMALLIVGALLIWGQAVLTMLLNSYVGPLLSMISPGGSTNIATTLINFVLNTTNGVGWAFFIMGIIFVVISGMGMCGACCKSTILLKLYAIFVGVLLLFQVILIIVYFANKSQFTVQAQGFMNSTLVKYTGFTQSQNAESLIWNVVQAYLGCCGVNNGSDFVYATAWSHSETFNNQTVNLTYPVTCCKMDQSFRLVDNNCTSNPNVTNSNYMTGCWFKLNNLIGKNIDIATYCLIGILGFQGLLILFAILIVRAEEAGKVSPKE